jgi:hypothetical protein
VADDTIMLVGDSHVETSLPFALMPDVLLGSALRALTGRSTRVVSVGAANEATWWLFGSLGLSDRFPELGG